MKKYKTYYIEKHGIDPADLSTSLFTNWEMEKLDFYIDRLVQAMHEDKLPAIQATIMIDEAQEASKELRNIFDYFYEREGRESPRELPKAFKQGWRRYKNEVREG